MNTEAAPITLTWKKDQRGRQVSTCGRYAVEVDGYTPGYMRDERDIRDGYQSTAEASMGVGGEWASVVAATDENLDWSPTMREAKAICQRHAERNS